MIVIQKTSSEVGTSPPKRLSILATMADAISIEETNRLRVSLGMKPLPVPGTTGPVFRETPSTPQEEAASTLETRQAESYDNYRKLQEAEEAKKKRDAKAEAVKKARDAAKRFAKLEGKGLGETDEEDMDAKTWLMKQRKRQKEIEKARKREKELAEVEAAAAEYTAQDLAGVKVGHEFSAFGEGEEQVLTLKDTTIDENEEEGDELENLDLRERERLNEKLELKKKKPVYNPNDTDETGERGILSHYDEEIEGKQGKRFTLDGKGSATEASLSASGFNEKTKAVAISLDILSKHFPLPILPYIMNQSLTHRVGDEANSDYLDLSEIDRKSTRLNSSHSRRSRMPSSA